MKIYESTKGVLYWITGLSGAGKTTIGTAVYYKLKEKLSNVILLDGDILKTILGDNIGYSSEDRHIRAMKYARLCKTLVDQGMIVICCTIAMFEDVRQWNRDNNDMYVEVFLDVPLCILKKRDQKGIYSKYNNGRINDVAGLDQKVELPNKPDILIENNGKLSIRECIETILEFSIEDTHKFNDDRNYWNNYYKNGQTYDTPSLFANYITKYIKSGYRLLDLGCGNGRDSRFLASKQLQVVGIDSAHELINNLRKDNHNDNILYVCDDFTMSNTLYQQQFDYCYSRFTLHAINEKQQKHLIKNVYNSLKETNDSGYFFIEARSIKDELFGKGITAGENAFIYQGHYRRFLVKAELEEQLRDCGFFIIESIEDRGLAPLNDKDPFIIRIIAKKRQA